MNPLTVAYEAIDTHAASEMHAATAKGLMTGYHARWQDAGWITIATEREFLLPIVNPDSGRISRTFNYAGKFDGIVEHHGQLFLLEHKTASDSIEDPNAPYWQRLDIDSQIDLYCLANVQLEQPVVGVLYDVVRKPGIKPKQVKGEGRIETTAEYAERLGKDTLERPGFYFGRRVIYRTDGQLLEAAGETWDIAKEIREARAGNRHYRNSNACLAWNRPCEYLPICSGRAAADDSSRYTRRKSLHVELPVLAESGADCKNILTNSRMACFRQCRRKHLYRFEEGIERINDEESDALTFGTLMHEAFKAWFDCFSGKELVNGNA